MQGVVKRIVFDRGFYFVTGQDGLDYFAHHSGIDRSVFDALREGDEVEFEPEAPGAKGPRARNVKVISPATS